MTRKVTIEEIDATVELCINRHPNDTEALDTVAYMLKEAMRLLPQEDRDQMVSRISGLTPDPFDAPEIYSQLIPGHRVDLGAHTFVVQVLAGYKDKIFLTAQHAARPDSYRSIHVRHKDSQCAVFSRLQLAKLIQSGDYIIG